MTRSPQPMRRMRYIIGELASQALVSTPSWAEAMNRASAWMGGAEDNGPWKFHIDITREGEVWLLTLKWFDIAPIMLLKMPLLAAPGPETVWIGPELRPVVIYPRPPATKPEIAPSDTLAKSLRTLLDLK